jgi:uncharacterized protein YjbI with pentapeptide repeats
MANQDQLEILKQGVEIWNEWRKQHQGIMPDLSNINLGAAQLKNVDLSYADLNEVILAEADLSNANLKFANLSDGDLRKATFYKADLSDATLHRTNLTETNFGYARLFFTDFSDAAFRMTNFNHASIWATGFGNVDLRQVNGLETMSHRGRSYVDIHTLYRSQGRLSETFLRGIGVPDTLIEYLHSLVTTPIQYYSCFISYSNKDEAFARRLYADLQSHNVRCWYAPEDLKIGDKFRHRIDESIRIYDKLLLVLSEASLESTWVSYEVEKALDKEPEGKHNVLFSIRLDKAILTCETDWAKEIRKSRHIGDFEHWKDHDAYQVAFERLLRDLKAQS